MGVEPLPLGEAREASVLSLRTLGRMSEAAKLSYTLPFLTFDMLGTKHMQRNSLGRRAHRGAVKSLISSLITSVWRECQHESSRNVQRFRLMGDRIENYDKL